MSKSSPVLHHVAIIVSDLNRASHLYGDILGLEPDFRPGLNFEGLFYKLGHGQQLHIMKLDNPDADSELPSHGGRYRHFALQVDNLTDITNKLTAEGIAFTASKSGRSAAFFYDDDGNAVELLQLG
ncbi:MAG: VOC family protein [Ghiorsea sp.]